MNGERKPSMVDRILRLFAEVRAGEGVNVVILALNVFILLTAYSMMKPLRSGLILVERGPEVTAYMSAAMAFILIPVIAVYGKLADRFPRRRLINLVTLFFALYLDFEMIDCLQEFFLRDWLGRECVQKWEGDVLIEEEETSPAIYSCV